MDVGRQGCQRRGALLECVQLNAAMGQAAATAQQTELSSMLFPPQAACRKYFNDCGFSRHTIPQTLSPNKVTIAIQITMSSNNFKPFLVSIRKISYALLYP
eukprot:2533001-Amphidinium_carterae.1